MSVCLHVCLCTAYVSRARGCQKRMLNGVTDGCEPIMWVLGTEPKSSGRATRALNHCHLTSASPSYNELSHIGWKAHYLAEGVGKGAPGITSASLRCTRGPERVREPLPC